MHGMDVFVLKNDNTLAPDTRKKPYVYEWSLIFSRNYFLEIYM